MLHLNSFDGQKTHRGKLFSMDDFPHDFSQHLASVRGKLNQCLVGNGAAPELLEAVGEKAMTHYPFGKLRLSVASIIQSYPPFST